MTLLVVLGLVYWDVSSALDDYQVYLLWMHAYASGYAFMEFDPDKLVNLKLADGPRRFSHFRGDRLPADARSGRAFRSAVISALWLAGFILAPLFALSGGLPNASARSPNKEACMRGELATLRDLSREIAAHNRDARAREYGDALGWRWRLAGSASLRDAGFYSPAHLAGVSWPWRLEQSHAMLVGTTGTGKTVVLTELTR